MYGNPQVDEKLPPESQMNRTDALKAFVAVVNTCKPEHAMYDDPWAPWPISEEDVEYGVTRGVHASCGPRKPWSDNVAYYATRLTHINELTREEHLALLCHEVTHITVCCGVDGYTAGHPKDFWREYAFYALELKDAIEDGVLVPVFGDIDVEKFLDEVVSNPNPATVDRRFWSVDECRKEMERLIYGDEAQDNQYWTPRTSTSI